MTSSYGGTCVKCGPLASWEIELHREGCGVVYTYPDSVVNMQKQDHYPACPYPSGYGKKIPTRWMIRYGINKTEQSQWRRVYVMQYSNAGSAYIFYRKKVVFIDGWTESELEKL